MYGFMTRHRAFSAWARVLYQGKRTVSLGRLSELDKYVRNGMKRRLRSHFLPFRPLQEYYIRRVSIGLKQNLGGASQTRFDEHGNFSETKAGMQG